MQIDLITIASNVPAWVDAGFQEYSKRLRAGGITVNLEEISLQKRTDVRQIAAARNKESSQVLAIAAKSSYIVALDERGKEYSSRELSEKVSFWQERTNKLAVIIGAPEGLSDEIRARADEFWSLGKLTLPHTLVRVVAVEALYRAWSITRNLPYHRD